MSIDRGEYVVYIELPENLCTSRPVSCVEAVKVVCVLREALNLPDGYKINELVADDSSGWGNDPRTWAVVIHHRVTTRYTELEGYFSALDQVLHNINNDEGGTPSKELFADLTTYRSVVEVVTPRGSVHNYHSAMGENVRERLASTDAVNRCVQVLRDYSRTLIVAYERKTHPVSYDNIISPVIIFNGHVEVTYSRPMLLREVGDWSKDVVLNLDQFNLPNFYSMDPIADMESGKFDHWLHELRAGSPFFRFRELLIAASRALTVEGDYGLCVILANTAGEVLLDGVLCLLFWEAGVTPEDARDIFDSKEFGPRVSSEIAGRLGGNWNTAGAGSYANWVEDTRNLRHKVVHAGYDPSWRQADLAYKCTVQLNTFILDRLADRRGTYPRATLMTLGSSGLQRRSLWAGRIKSFSETVAPTEQIGLLLLLIGAIHSNLRSAWRSSR